MGAVSAAPQIFYKLSSDDSLPIGGDVNDFKISSDGATTVYRAGQDVAEVRELYSVPTDRSADPKKISNLSNRRRGIIEYLITPDNTFVIYNADQDEEDLFELYSAALDGSSGPIKISAEMVENGGLRDNGGSFKISADGSQVVYRAQQEIDEVYELYVVPSDGSAEPLKLNGMLPEGGGTFSYDITPNNKYLVYTADQDEDNLIEMYSVPMDGGEVPLKISGELVENGDISQFKISPDSQYVTYLADQETDGVRELFMVPVDGSALPIKLNGTLVEDGSVGFGSNFFISPDSKYVVYLADQDINDVDELYSVPITGGMSIKLNGMLTPGGEVDWVWEPQISSDSKRVVYLADQDTNDLDEIYSVPITGGLPVKLNGPLAGTFLYDFEISQDSSQVVYRARQDDPDAYELYTTPLTGGAIEKLNDPLPDDDRVVDFKISPDSSHIAYMTDNGMNAERELFRVPITGGLVSMVNPPLIAGGEVRRFEISADNSHILYIADQEMNDVEELFQTTLTDPGPVIKLNSTLAIGADIWTFEITNNSEYVLYLADHSRLFRNDLYRVRLDGSDDPLKLSEGLAGDYYLWDLEITPDGNWAVLDYNVTGGPDAVYSVPVDGSSNPIKLSMTAIENARVHYFRLSGDSQYVVYRAEEDTSTVWEIYSALVDGSGMQTKLNGELVEDGEVHSFRIGPSSLWVVYTADQETDEVVEIYSVPIGGGIPTKLNALLPENGSVEENNFAISPDGLWVAYIADQDTAGIPELYLVPIDGSADPKKVNGELVEDGSVHWFEFSPDGSFLVYYANQDDADVDELYGFSINAPAEAQKLNAPLTNDYYIDWFEFTPDGSTLIYVISSDSASGPAVHEAGSNPQGLESGSKFFSIALPDGLPVELIFNLTADEYVYDLIFSQDSKFMVFMVYSETIPDSLARESGSKLYSVAPSFLRNPVQINDPVVEESPIQDFWISSDDQVVYYELSRTPGEYKLFSTAIDGRTEPENIVIPLIEGGFVYRSEISPDDNRLVYTADQDTLDVEELYASTLPALEIPDPTWEIYLPAVQR